MIQLDAMQYETIIIDSIWYCLLRHNMIQLDAMWYDTIQIRSIRYGLIRYDIIQLDAMQYDTIIIDSKWYRLIRHNMIQLDAIWYDTIRIDSIRCGLIWYVLLYVMLWYPAVSLGNWEREVPAHKHNPTKTELTFRILINTAHKYNIVKYFNVQTEMHDIFLRTPNYLHPTQRGHRGWGFTVHFSTTVLSSKSQFKKKSQHQKPLGFSKPLQNMERNGWSQCSFSNTAHCNKQKSAFKQQNQKVLNLFFLFPLK